VFLWCRCGCPSLCGGPGVWWRRGPGKGNRRTLIPNRRKRDKTGCVYAAYIQFKYQNYNSVNFIKHFITEKFTSSFRIFSNIKYNALNFNPSNWI